MNYFSWTGTAFIGGRRGARSSKCWTERGHGRDGRKYYSPDRWSKQPDGQCERSDCQSECSNGQREQPGWQPGRSNGTPHQHRQGSSTPATSSTPPASLTWPLPATEPMYLVLSSILCIQSPLLTVFIISSYFLILICSLESNLSLSHLN